MKSWLEKNTIEIYSICNEEKFVDGEDLLESSIIKFINTWLQCQKMCILIK